jgi:hypothetical protein
MSGLRPGNYVPQEGGRKEMMLLIKPSPEASYKNVINLLDETLINQVKRYALEDITAGELQELARRALAKG